MRTLNSVLRCARFAIGSARSRAIAPRCTCLLTDSWSGLSHFSFMATSDLAGGQASRSSDPDFKENDREFSTTTRAGVDSHSGTGGRGSHSSAAGGDEGSSMPYIVGHDKENKVFYIEMGSASEDSKFSLLQERLVGSTRGKGRPSKQENERERDNVEALKSVSIDNRLFLQFSMLKEKGHSWNELRVLFGDILNLKEVAYCDVKPLVTTCVRQLASHPQDEAEKFLSSPKDIAWPGPFCKAKGVTKKFLLEEHHGQNFSQMDTLSVGLLLEIATYCDHMSFTGARMLSMLQKVCRADNLQTTEAKIVLAEVNRLKKEVQKAQKSKKGDAGKVLRETSRLTPVPVCQESEQSTRQPSSQEQEQSTVVEVAIQANLPCLCTHDVELRPDPDTKRRLHTACAQVTGLEEVIEAQKEKIKTLMEALETKERAIAAQAKTILALRAGLKGTKDNLERTKQKLKEKCKECAEEKSSALYQRNYRRKLRLDKQEADIKTRQALQQEVEEERRLKRKAQNQASDANRKRKRMEADLSKARESVRHMEDQVAAAEVATQTRGEREGERAVLEYEWLRPGLVNLYHTEVPPAFRGRGVAKLLAQAALEHFSGQEKVKMRLTCTYLAKYVQDNPLPRYTACLEC